LDADRVNAEVPEAPVIEVGLKTPVTPVGNPVTLKATVPVKLSIGVTVTFTFELVPFGTVAVTGTCPPKPPPELT
jgi:hypothetical protein